MEETGKQEKNEERRGIAGNTVDRRLSVAPMMDWTDFFIYPRFTVALYTY